MTDSAALLLALIANLIGQRPANAGKSYGYARAELIGALVNSLTMIALVVWIIVEAVQRLLHPQPVNGMGVMVIAVIGLLVNVFSAWQLSHDHDNLNSRAALIHVLGDLLGSVAAIAAGAVIYYTGWMPIDPILSIAVSLLILRSTWNLLSQSTHLLMEGVPDGIDLNQVGEQLSAVPGIVEVHDLHVWSIGSKRKALSAHLIISEPLAWPSLILQLNQMLEKDYVFLPKPANGINSTNGESSSNNNSTLSRANNCPTWICLLTYLASPCSRALPKRSCSCCTNLDMPA